MSHLIDGLLSLTRLESNQVVLKKEDSALRPYVEKCWLNVAEHAKEREIAFENTLSEQAHICLDLNYLTVVLLNLFENAVTYADSGERVGVESQEGLDGTVLSVWNTGCTLGPEDIERMFDPFWRKEKSRYETGNHCGIGLPIVKKVVTALGGTLQAEIRPGSIFAIQLKFPNK